MDEGEHAEPTFPISITAVYAAPLGEIKDSRPWAILVEELNRMPVDAGFVLTFSGDAGQNKRRMASAASSMRKHRTRLAERGEYLRAGGVLIFYRGPGENQLTVRNAPWHVAKHYWRWAEKYAPAEAK